MTAVYQELGRTSFEGRVSEVRSTDREVVVRILTLETEAAEVLAQHVLTAELSAQSIATAKAADRGRFQPWAKVRDALRPRRP